MRLPILAKHITSRPASALLPAVIVVAALLRFWSLDHNPVALNQDEAVGGYDAFAIAETLRDHHGNFLPVLFESFEDWVSPVLTYVTAPFVKLFGLSELTIRGVVALAGCGTVWLMYLVLLELGLGVPVALGGALALALAPWHITLSRWAIPPSIVPCTLLLTLWTALRAQPSADRAVRTPWARWIAFVIAAALLTYSYPTQKLFAPLWVASIIGLVLWPRWKQALALATTYAALVSPMYWLALRDPRRYNARFNDVALDFHQSGIVWEVMRRYGEYWLSDFFFGRGDTDPMHHVPGSGAMSPVLALLFFVGVAATAGRALGKDVFDLKLTRRVAGVLLAWLVLFPLPASLTRDHMHLLRAVHGLPAVLVFASVGAYAIVNGLASLRARRVVGLAVLIVMAIDCAVFTGEYWDRYRLDTRGHFQYGLRQVIERALALESGYREVKVTRDVNSAYIYYLFVSKKDPRTLDHSQINEHVDGSGNWLHVSRIGTWSFEGVTDDDVRGARQLYRVQTDGQVWRSLWANGSTLLIR